MIIRLSTMLLCCAAAAACQHPPAEPPAACSHDRARLLALDEQEFDQDMAGGWRELAGQPGCMLVAADLLHDYRAARHSQAGLLYWHEAQLRAFAGQSQQAITLMEGARKPASDDRAGWNQYVDATIAFLHKDRAALERARSALAAVVPPIGPDIPPVIDGYMQADMGDGTTRRIRWPPNLDVVEGLLHCFDQPYERTYGDACRPE